jgi:hypothetical protein
MGYAGCGRSRRSAAVLILTYALAKRETANQFGIYFGIYDMFHVLTRHHRRHIRKRLHVGHSQRDPAMEVL